MAQEHIEYIKKVLSSWEKFCESHRLLAEAMREILRDAENLKLLRDLLKESADHDKS